MAPAVLPDPCYNSNGADEDLIKHKGSALVPLNLAILVSSASPTPKKRLAAQPLSPYLRANILVGTLKEDLVPRRHHGLAGVARTSSIELVSDHDSTVLLA